MRTPREFLQWVLVGLTLGCVAHSHAGLIPGSYPPGDLDFLVRETPVIRRTVWNTIPIDPDHLRSSKGFTRITIHHTGTRVVEEWDFAAVTQELRNIATGHKERGYGDIAYHFIIDAVGRVWEGRELAYDGAHVYGANAGNIGIMVLGNFELQRPTLAQLAALEDLVGRLKDHFGITSANLFGHRDMGRTLCPGVYLYPFVLQLRGATE